MFWLTLAFAAVGAIGSIVKHKQGLAAAGHDLATVGILEEQAKAEEIRQESIIRRQGDMQTRRLQASYGETGLEREQATANRDLALLHTAEMLQEDIEASGDKQRQYQIQAKRQLESAGLQAESARGDLGLAQGASGVRAGSASSEAAGTALEDEISSGREDILQDISDQAKYGGAERGRIGAASARADAGILRSFDESIERFDLALETGRETIGFDMSRSLSDLRAGTSDELERLGHEGTWIEKQIEYGKSFEGWTGAIAGGLVRGASVGAGMQDVYDVASDFLGSLGEGADG